MSEARRSLRSFPSTNDSWHVSADRQSRWAPMQACYLLCGRRKDSAHLLGLLEVQYVTLPFHHIGLPTETQSFFEREGK